jgi:hypothetical protein
MASLLLQPVEGPLVVAAEVVDADHEEGDVAGVRVVALGVKLVTRRFYGDDSPALALSWG